VKYRRFVSVLALLAAVNARAATAPKSANETVSAESRSMTYSLIRNGSRIGTMTETLSAAGDVVTTTTQTDIEVKVIIVLYHFTQSTSETWKGDQFVSFTSETDDNGTPHKVAVNATPKGMSITADGKTSSAPMRTMPMSFWSTRFLNAKALINNNDGSVTNIVSKNLGPEQISVGGSLHQAQHYKISGGTEFERDLWFERDQLLRLRLKGSDGSLISSDLDSEPPAAQPSKQ
jgi:hypothetical protein